MIIQRNVSIKNRHMLQLAIDQTRKQKDDQRLVLRHNAEVVREKWTLNKMASSFVNVAAPSIFGNVILYATSVFTAPQDSDGESSTSHWKTILLELMKTFGNRIMEKHA